MTDHSAPAGRRLVAEVPGNWFDIEPTGKPSRWNTLRAALRAVRWHEQATNS